MLCAPACYCRGAGGWRLGLHGPYSMEEAHCVPRARTASSACSCASGPALLPLHGPARLPAAAHQSPGPPGQPRSLLPWVTTASVRFVRLWSTWGWPHVRLYFAWAPSLPQQRRPACSAEHRRQQPLQSRRQRARQPRAPSTPAPKGPPEALRARSQPATARAPSPANSFAGQPGAAAASEIPPVERPSRDESIRRPAVGATGRADAPLASDWQGELRWHFSWAPAARSCSRCGAGPAMWPPSRGPSWGPWSVRLGRFSPPPGPLDRLPQSYAYEEVGDSASGDEGSGDEGLQLQGLSGAELKKAIRWVGTPASAPPCPGNPACHSTALPRARYLLRAGRRGSRELLLPGAASARTERTCRAFPLPRRKKNRDSARRMRAKRVQEFVELRSQVRRVRGDLIADTTAASRQRARSRRDAQRRPCTTPAGSSSHAPHSALSDARPAAAAGGPPAGSEQAAGRVRRAAEGRQGRAHDAHQHPRPAHQRPDRGEPQADRAAAEHAAWARLQPPPGAGPCDLRPDTSRLGLPRGTCLPLRPAACAC